MREEIPQKNSVFYFQWSLFFSSCLFIYFLFWYDSQKHECHGWVGTNHALYLLWDHVQILAWRLAVMCVSLLSCRLKKMLGCYMRAGCACFFPHPLWFIHRSSTSWWTVWATGSVFQWILNKDLIYYGYDALSPSSPHYFERIWCLHLRRVQKSRKNARVNYQVPPISPCLAC